MTDAAEQGWAERAEQLARELIAPLVLGGEIRLGRPFGARVALGLGLERSIVDTRLGADIGLGRLRVARSLVPVDALPDLGPSEWALCCGLNDLLQATNHQLSSLASRGRHGELLGAVHELCAALPAPATLGELVCRHATFSGALAVSRTDHRVSWWSGRASFRGQEPPARLLAWPELRRVDVARSSVPLAQMHHGVSVPEHAYHGALAAWLGCSPLTDLACAARPAPRFGWSPLTVSVVASTEGANLALRAIEFAGGGHADHQRAAIAALNAAAAALPEGSAAAAIALEFVAELHAAATLRRQRD